MAGAVLMAVRNENLIYKDIYKGIHDDENNVWLCQSTIFSSFLPLVLFCRERSVRLS